MNALRESLDLILKCWTAKEPFDWDGKHWRGKGIVATPQPLHAPHMPMATATDTEATIELAGARGYTLLMAQLEPAGSIRKNADRYMRAAKAAGRDAPLNNLAVARYVYLADSRREAMDDLRADINYELGYQIKRGLIRLIKSNYDIGVKGDEVTFDQLAEAGIYYLGDPDTVAKQLARILRGRRRLRHAADRRRQEMGDPRQGLPLDAAVRGAGGAAVARAWCRRAIPDTVAA